MQRSVRIQPLLHTLLGGGLTAAASLLAGLTGPTPARALISHSAADFSGTQTPPFGSLTEAVGTFFLNKGVNYSFGNFEGVFVDGSALAFCGINVDNICDLLSDVDAQIVVPGTTAQGLTNFLLVEAGLSEPGSLTLTALGSDLSILATALNGPPDGPNGRTTFTIDRGTSFDIAYYSVSGGDSYGVNYVEIGDPIAAKSSDVPGPLPVLGAAAAFRMSRRLRRRTARPTAGA